MKRRTLVTALIVMLTASTLVLPGSVAAQSSNQGAKAPHWPYPDWIVDQAAPVNGCGSQGDDGWDVPDQIGFASFTESCDWHDRCYGTKGLSQGYCDRGMLKRTQAACGWDPICKRVSVAYFIAVSALGGGPYREGQELGCRRHPQRDGRVHGDPHLITFDGSYYSFMAAGEFALVRDRHGDDLVQTRFFPQSDSFTLSSGVAMRLGERVVTVQIDPETSEVTVFIDSEPVTASIEIFEEGVVELGTVLEGVQQVVTIRRWDGLRVEALAFRGRLDVAVNVPQGEWGEISGLLGDADGNPSNDLIDRNGTAIEVLGGISEAVYDDDFVSEYRIHPDDSMFIADSSGFDYHADDIGKYPIEQVAIASFDQALIASARNVCSRAGLDGQLLESCVFDVLASGDESYADSSARSARRALDVAHPHGRHGSDDVNLVLAERPPLIIAIEDRDIAAVRALLDEGADPNVGRQLDGITPLVAALLLDEPEILQLLLDRGADPNAFDIRQMSPLTFAVMVARDNILVQLLLDAGADPNLRSADGILSPLHVAAAGDDVDLVQLLLDAGANPNHQEGTGDGGGWTPLHLATSTGSFAVVELLLGAGADPNRGWRIGMSVGPLYNAASTGRVDVVRLLLDAGADPRSAFFSGLDPTLYITDEEIQALLGIG